MRAHDWELWSTTARLVVTDDSALEPALDMTRRILADVELASSRFRDDSEIRNLVPGPDGSHHRVTGAGRPAGRGAGRRASYRRCRGPDGGRDAEPTWATTATSRCWTSPVTGRWRGYAGRPAGGSSS